MRMRKLAFILAIVTAVTVLLAGCNTSSNKPDKPPQAATITKEKYDKIAPGVSYEEAVKIIGGDGRIIAESGTKGDPDYSVTYQFPVEGKADGNAKLTFNNNKLTSKSENNM